MTMMPHGHILIDDNVRCSCACVFPKRVEEVMGHALEGEVGLHMVRSVAPNKDMYCISFRLPYEVAFAA